MKKKILIQIAFLVFLLPVSAQSAAEKFIGYLNNYDREALSEIITPDFKLTRSFSDKVTTREEFLESYLTNSEALLARYKIIEEPKGKGRDYYVVLDQSQYLKLLDVKFPTWKMKIKTVRKKVSLVTLEPTEDYDSYVQQLEQKRAAFDEWMNRENPAVYLETDDLASLLPYMLLYALESNMDIYNLQQYEDEAFAAEARQLSDKEEEELDDIMLCYHSKKYSAAKMRKMYPFSQAEKVVIISFYDPSQPEYISKYNKIPNLSVAATSKELSAAGIDKLEDIIYNVGFKKEILIKTIVELDACPELKNAVVFIDGSGKPFEYIELFFGCDQVELSSEKVTFGDDCTNKIRFMKDFFEIEEIETGK